MREYLIEQRDEFPEGAFVQPAENIYASSIVLSDSERDKSSRSSRAANVALCLQTFSESDVDEMSFQDEVVPKPTISDIVRRKIGRSTAGIRRIWHWNISHPVRMWFHFRFRREHALPDDVNALRALLRHEFVKAGITDADIPYAICAREDREAKPKPGKFDLIFNRKRIRA